MKSTIARRSRLSVEALEPRWVLSSGFQPTAADQLLLEQLNDIRANPAAYGQAIGLNLGGVAPSQPLAFDPLLIQAAQQHAQDMNDRGYFDHNTPDGVDPGQRLTNVGVPWTSWGESSAAGSAYPDSASALRALIIDTGISDLGHRQHLLALAPIYQTQNEVGVGIVQGGNGPLTNYYTIDTAVTNDNRPFLTGAIFSDDSGSGKYAIGEGLSHVLITVSNGTTTTSTTDFDSGGYSIRLDPGTYTVTISGGGLTTSYTQTVTIGASNVRLNFALPPGSDQPQGSAFIGLLYRDLLGRLPSGDEVNGWTTLLHNGTTRTAIVNGFVGSQEYAQRLVTQWFQQYLHRAPDNAGLATFENDLLQGTSEAAVRLGILTSPEYYAIHGSTPINFVDALYQDLLGRAPGGQEASAWAVAASDGNRTGVVAGIQGSNEFFTHEVNGVYDTYLRRFADSSGQATFVSQLSHGTDERTVISNIVSSQEYYNEAEKTLWIRSLYQDVLGRNGDNVNELGSWLAHLNSDMDRAAVANAFLTSPEATNRTVIGLYTQLLGRQPDTAGFQLYSHQLQTTGHVSSIIDQIVSGPEYYHRQGGTNTAFVRGLYLDLLGRGASDTEVFGWLNKFNQGESQAQVAADFMSAPEFQQHFITTLFNRYLRRPPTASELSQYVAQLQSGATDFTLAGQIVASDEYFLSPRG
jgi:uncharacterized protein YkwD